jgi:hypothetical protein
MSPHADAVADSLALLPPDMELAVVIAGDRTTVAVEPGRGPGHGQRAAAAVRAAAFAGGCDNVPALLQAWDLAAAGINGAILWLHATQPLELLATEGLVQRWERRPNGPPLYDMQFGTGPNVIATRLDGLHAVRGVARLSDPSTDLKRLVAGWDGSRTPFEIVRTVDGDPPAPDAPRATDHVVRLWAQAAIARLSASRTQADRDAALTMAGVYQLVTPVSGAVVLENAAQYKEAGLSPVSPESTPGIVPEPHTLVLFVLGAALILLKARRRRAAT